MRFAPRRPAAGHEPAVNITPVAGALIAICIAVHLGRLVLSPAWDEAVMIHGGFFPGDFLWPGGVIVLPLDLWSWLSAVTYAFLHADALHLLLNMGFVLAFGTGLERRLGGPRLLAFYLLCAVLALGGSLLAQVFHPGPVLLVGASGAISGLFAGALWILWLGPPQRFADLPRHRDPKPIIIAAAVFAGINVLIGVTGLTPSAGVQGIAWEAHLGGFVAGWVFFPLFDRR